MESKWINPAKVKAICQWPRPVDGKSLQRFLETANFYRDFSHKYSKIAAPLESIKNKPGTIEWTTERIESFENIKKLFASNLSLHTINWKKPIYLTTDASLTGIGAWIGQKDEFDNLIPIVCISKKLSDTQQRWSTTKRELYALMWSMQKLRSYLLGRQFYARVDHKPLVDMLKNKINLMMEGWIDTILQFDFIPIYISGNENELADALSRSHEDEFVNMIAKKTLLTEELSNHDIEVMLEAERRGKKVPNPEEQTSLIEKEHLLGHFSTETTLKKLWRAGYWWPKMRNDIAAKISQCIDCQRFDIAKEGYHPLITINAQEPWDHIQIDLVGPIPESNDGYSWILTIIDVMSGFTLLRPLRSKSMEEVAIALWQLICDFGPPKIMQSDNGTEFVNSVIAQLVNLFGIDRRLITPYNPRADGLVERKNKELGRLLKKLMKGSSYTWNLLLPITQLSLNLKELRRIGTEPFTLFFGRPFNQFKDHSNTPITSNYQQVIENRLNKLRELRDIVWPVTHQRSNSQQNHKAQQHNIHTKIIPPLNPGTQVMIKDVTRESKWDPIYEGPYTVIKQVRGGSYLLQDQTGTQLNRTIPIDHIKIIDDKSSRGRKDSHKSPINPSTNSNDHNSHYEVLGIVKHRVNKNNKGHDYLVRWKGYTEADDSWVSEEDFDDIAIIKRYWKQFKQGQVKLPNDRTFKKKNPKSKST